LKGCCFFSLVQVIRILTSATYQQGNMLSQQQQQQQQLFRSKPLADCVFARAVAAYCIVVACPTREAGAVGAYRCQSFGWVRETIAATATATAAGG
jgi:hypothetical protein